MYRIKYANRQIRDIYVCGNECSKLVARCVWNGGIRMGVWGMIWQERDLYVRNLHVLRKSQEHKKKKSIDAADQSKDCELGERST